MQELIAAFTQDEFELLILLNDATYQYKCYAADYTVNWTREALHSNKMLVSFQVPRDPIPVQGV